MIEKLISLMEKPSTDKFDHLCMTKLHLFWWVLEKPLK
jgi:hypothetical protein